jgi:hypothetical protein
MQDTIADERVNILLVDDQPARLLSYETSLGAGRPNHVWGPSGIESLVRLFL